jgi:hypothetical protein
LTHYRGPVSGNSTLLAVGPAGALREPCGSPASDRENVTRDRENVTGSRAPGAL